MVYISTLLLLNNVHAQELMRSVIASSGNYTAIGNYSLNITIGETVTETQMASSFALTQGFQQSDDLGVISFNEEVNRAELELKIYPNPVLDNLNLFINDKDNIVNLFYVNGDLLLSASGQNRYRLNLKTLLTGVYFLEIRLDHGSITEPIIKI